MRESPIAESWRERDWRGLLAETGALAMVAQGEPFRPSARQTADGRGGIELFGFALVRVVLDEAELYAIGVAPECRRRGLATALLRGVSDISASLGARTLFLEVAQSNGAAYALYSAQGFCVVGRRPGYYRSCARPETALVMAKPLAQPQNPTDRS